MTCNAMAFFNPDFMLHPRDDDHHHPHSSLTPILPSCTPQDFHGVASLLGKRSMSFSGLEMCEEMNGDDDLSDDCSQAGEKKRRLNIEQVKTLEKNFELGNKLEPERKMQLARALGLQPRQIAIWFQNRRARWKTKQLEKDYDLLKRQFEALKADNDLLRAQNKKFQAEILVLKKNRESETINLNKETEGSCSNRSDNSSDLNLGISKTVVDSPLTPHPQRPIFPVTRSGNMIQLLQNTSRTEVPCQKIMAAGDHDENPVQEENFCNMFIGIDDHSTFWPWQDHCPQNFH